MRARGEARGREGLRGAAGGCEEAGAGVGVLGPGVRCWDLPGLREAEGARPGWGLLLVVEPGGVDPRSGTR